MHFAAIRGNVLLGGISSELSRQVGLAHFGSSDHRWICRWLDDWGPVMEMIIVTFVLSCIWYYAMQHLRAAKNGSTIRRNIRLEEGWKIRLSAWQAQRYDAMQGLEKALQTYEPVPVLVPSYEQQRSTRESDGPMIEAKERVYNGRIWEFIERG